MLTKWDEAATWNSFDEGITPDDIEAVRTADIRWAPGGGSVGQHVVDVRAALQAWSNGAPYLGWVLINSSTNGWDFSSSENSTTAQRPHLAVVAVPPSPGIFQFSAATLSVNEAVSVLTVTVTRTGGTAGAATVEYVAADETAAKGLDYKGASGVLFFEDGQQSATFTVSIVTDAEVEEDETFVLMLQNPTDGTLVGELCTTRVTLVDNDGPGILQLSAARYTVNENSKTATITVTRSRASDGVVTVDYFTADETATDGVDYQGLVKTLVFQKGETSQTFTITIFDDKELEVHETLLIGLFNPKGGATLGRQDTAVLTIMDNEPRLLIQQGRNGYAGTDDTELYLGTPGTPRGNNDIIEIDLEDAGATQQQRQGLIKFADLFGPGKNQIPKGAIIRQATLRFEATDGSGGNISLHRMLVSWTENSTWDSMVRGLQPITEFLLTPDALLSPASGTGPRDFDVTAALLAWQEGQANHGWAIFNSSGDGWRFATSEFATAAQRPFLSIVYVLPGGAPSGGDGIDASVPDLLADGLDQQPTPPVVTGPGREESLRIEAFFGRYGRDENGAPVPGPVSLSEEEPGLFAAANLLTESTLEGGIEFLELTVA